MIKNIFTTFLAIILLSGCAILENHQVTSAFSKFSEYIEQTQIKIQSGNFSVEESKGLENYWIETKKSLHMWIPHNEIKEIDLWVFECTKYTKQKNYKEALCKLAVLKNLSEEIPKTFLLSFENIF